MKLSEFPRMDWYEWQQVPDVASACALAGIAERLPLPC